MSADAHIAEREQMVALLEQTFRELSPYAGDYEMARCAADALIAAGWTRGGAEASRLLASAQGIVAAMRVDCKPGPAFKALNEVIGVLEEMRRTAHAKSEAAA